MKKFYFILVLLVMFLPVLVFAKTDLSITETDITFSKDEPLEGDVVRVYARIFNNGDTDASGFVVFLDNGKEMADPQPVSIRVNTFDDVFIDWTTKQGKHDIKASIVGLNPKDEVVDNNSTTKKAFLVDIDTDKDGLADEKDTDADNDGLVNDEEIKLSTNPKLADTDGDKVNDKIDVFPLDKTEWRDTNNNGIGDNKDPDIDGDGLTNEQEKQLGTNPLVADNPTQQEQNSAQNNSSPDKSLLQASLFGSIKDLFTGENKYLFWGLGVFSLIILYFMFRKKKRRR